MAGPQITQPKPIGGSSGGGGSGSTPTVVQRGVNAGATHGSQITLGSTPVQGNLLLAFVTSNVTGNLSAGWASIVYNGSGTDYGNIAYKIAGAAEPKLQEPSSDTGGLGACAIYEIATAAPALLAPAVNYTGVSPSIDPIGFRAGGLLIGAFMPSNSDAVTGLTGAVADLAMAAGGRSVNTFKKAIPVVGDNVVSGTFANSNNAKLLGVILY